MKVITAITPLMKVMMVVLAKGKWEKVSYLSLPKFVDGIIISFLFAEVSTYLLMFYI